jgi:hypothetical protein
MTAALQVYERLCRDLGYADADGLVWTAEQALGGVRSMLVERARRHLPKVDAIYFAGEVPLAYFAVGGSTHKAQVASLHRQVWNDARVPILFVIDAAQVRVYDAWAEPTTNAERIDDEERLVRALTASEDFLRALPELQRARLDSGAYAADLPGRFDASRRCDTTLIENLEATRNRLVEGKSGLRCDVAHLLLLRSILLLHLEHRGVLGPSIYGQFLRGARKLTDVYDSRESTYRLFGRLAEKFNGDLLPVQPEEGVVQQAHLRLLRCFLQGEEEVTSGQRTLWPLYDFSVVPIQLLSAVYERLLHGEDPDAAKKEGAFYTPYPLVELMMNEVLPWPDPDKSTTGALPRICDPSCGSGVFLVEAYRRLVAHWRRRQPAATSDCASLSQLLSAHIFGIDKNVLAVRVAAFSLCLALLDEVDTAEVWSRLRFPRLTTATRSAEPNLVTGDAFAQERTTVSRFDLIIGNPPWRRRRLLPEIESWCNAKGYPVAGEIAQAFMWLARDLAPAGQVALLSPSKWLFNREKPDVAFRRAFFAKNHVEAVINLSALVGGDRRLFNASAPATAIVFHRSSPNAAAGAVLYCTPRPGSLAGLPAALALDGGDIKWIPRHEAEVNDDVWKALYVGSWRDLRLVRRLRATGATLGDFLKARKVQGWAHGRGFQPSGDKPCTRILELPFLDASDMTPYILQLDPDAESWATDGFKRTGPEAIYEGPHLVFKEGLVDRRLCAAFSTQGFSFRDTVTGIHAPPGDSHFLKALTVYLTSSLAGYLLFLTSGWGIDRRRVKKGEVLALPVAFLRRKEVVAKLAELFDAFGEQSSVDRRKSLIEQMDDAVYEVFDLSSGERRLVKDLFATAVSYVHDGPDSRSFRPPRAEELTAYAGAFSSVLSQVFSESGQTLSARIHLGDSPMFVVSFRIEDGRGGRNSVTAAADERITQVLDSLSSRVWQREGINLYRRRHLRIFEDRVLHIVKPAERRFWTRSAAYSDADETLAQVLASKPHAGR